MQTSRLHTPRLNGTPTIQPVEELVAVKIEVNCELIVPAHFHPANHGTDHHFLCLDSGRIVQISKGKDGVAGRPITLGLLSCLSVTDITDTLGSIHQSAAELSIPVLRRQRINGEYRNKLFAENWRISFFSY